MNVEPSPTLDSAEKNIFQIEHPAAPSAQLYVRISPIRPKRLSLSRIIVDPGPEPPNLGQKRLWTREHADAGTDRNR
jgi:hypothetical protein